MIGDYEAYQYCDDDLAVDLLSEVVTWVAVQTMEQLEEVLIFLKKIIIKKPCYT